MAAVSDSVNKALREVDSLRVFEGAGPDFWSGCLNSLSRLVGADQAVLLCESSEGSGDWKQLLVRSATPGALPAELQGVFNKRLTSLATEALRQVHVIAPLEGCHASDAFALAVRLVGPADARATVAVFCLQGLTNGQAAEYAVRLRLASDLPRDYVRQCALQKTRDERESCEGILQVVVDVYEQDRFVAACMTLCNALAQRYGCDQVGLGFLKNNQYVRLQALSGTVKFDKKADAVRELEIVMEEAADQDEEVVWPLPEGFSAISREHERYARARAAGHLCSVPLRFKEAVFGVLSAERQEQAFSESELRQMSLVGDVVAARLRDLRRRDRWFVLRWVSAVREGFARLLGVEHTWAKLAGVVASAAVIVVLFGSAPYRVEAPFIVKADRMAVISAPFDGFVTRVAFDIGDRVPRDRVLLALDRKELLLEKSSALADLQRHERDAEKHWAEDALADMQISRALAAQVRARLDLVNYRLERSELKAPFDGVVVEGEWQEKVDSSVRQGEMLLKMAQLDSLYLELKIEGSDIARVDDRMLGQAAFISDPRTKHAFRMKRIRPAAVTEVSGPVFHARAEFTSERADWWRPGMSGIAKIDAGKRRLWWIFGHKTVDFLRRTLWW